MKKILLTLTVLTGLAAFSIEGPKYEVGGSVGYNFEKSAEGNVKTKHFVVPNINFTAKWNKEINDQMKVTFGPKVSGLANIQVKAEENNKTPLSFAILASGVVGLEYQVKEDINIYAEAEAGIGPKIKTGEIPKASDAKEVSRFSFAYAAKASAGVKYKNYKLGAFGGYGSKGVAGIELGYEF